MQAAVFKGVGLPLSIETRPDPVPGAREIVLRVGRCGICGTDLSMTDGSGQIYETDSIIGHEFAGEVVATGTAVSRFKAGDCATALPYTGCGQCATCLARHRWLHSRHGDGPLVHFLADPLGTVRSLYEHFGIELSAATEQAMRSWIAADPTSRHAEHRYSIDSFGITEDEIRSQFADYRSEYQFK